MDCPGWARLANSSGSVRVRQNFLIWSFPTLSNSSSFHEPVMKHLEKLRIFILLLLSALTLSPLPENFALFLPLLNQHTWRLAPRKFRYTCNSRVFVLFFLLRKQSDNLRHKFITYDLISSLLMRYTTGLHAEFSGRSMKYDT